MDAQIQIILKDDGELLVRAPTNHVLSLGMLEAAKEYVNRQHRPKVAVVSAMPQALERT